MNNNLAQEILQDAASRLNDMGNGEGFSLSQQDAVMNVVSKVMNGKILALQADLQSIYNALKYAGSFIKTGRKEEEAKAQLLAAMKQISRYTAGEPESAADLTEESNDPRSHAPVTFKVDDVPVRVGNDMRVEYEDKEEGRTLIVVLTHEGIIMDLWNAGDTEAAHTSSIMYNEKIEEMLDEQSGMSVIEALEILGQQTSPETKEAFSKVEERESPHTKNKKPQD
jgi:hypothetical protein